MEMDLVDHSGGLESGDFVYTLNMTDVCTGWTEMIAVQNKAQEYVFDGLKVIRQRMPISLKGIVIPITVRNLSRGICCAIAKRNN